MSDSGSNKSMDDVLASIRRIVRAEKDQGSEASGSSGPEPEPETSPVEEPEPMTGDTPLELTPDMRSDAAPSVGDPVPPPPAPAPSVDVEEEVQSPQSAPAMPTLDQDALRDIVRATVIEQLSGADAEEIVRGVIRDELVNGEIGGNISQNVLRLIQAEVGKALKG